MGAVSVPPLLHYRGPYFSEVYLPDQALLDALGDKMPFAFLLFDSASEIPGGVVAAQQAERGSIEVPEDCWLTHLVGSSVLAGPARLPGNFVAQFYDAGREQMWGGPIMFGNMMGTALAPFYLRKPYRLPSNGQLQCRVTNLAAVAAAIQIVGWGLRN